MSERVTSAPVAVRFGPRSPLVANSPAARAIEADVDEPPASNGPPALRGDALAVELQRASR